MQQQQAMMQQQAMQAQPTGYRSNNPFAPGNTSILPTSPMPMPTPQPQQQQQQYFPEPTPAPAPIQPQQTATPLKSALKKPKDDGQHAHLAGLLANRDDNGMDTFGNTGALRKCC